MPGTAIRVLLFCLSVRVYASAEFVWKHSDFVGAASSRDGSAKMIKGLSRLEAAPTMRPPDLEQFSHSLDRFRHVGIAAEAAPTEWLEVTGEMTGHDPMSPIASRL